MTKIVFTGGPSAGKSSFIQSLKLKVLDRRKDVFFAPEIATMLLSQGFPRFSDPKNIIHQQRAIFKTQMEMEDLLEKENRYTFCFFDRGLPDALAYVNNPKDVFKEDYEKLFKRYDNIFHLEVAPMESYTKINNNTRTESHKEALELENRLRVLWSKHKNYSFIESRKTFQEKFKDFFKNHSDICGINKNTPPSSQQNISTKHNF